MAPRWGGLRLDPYKPDAVDADHDGVVQEDTAFERPAGTRLLNSLGQAILAGMTSAEALDGLRFVDADGKDVAYTPRWAGKIADAGPDTGGLSSLQDSGAKIVGDFSASLKERGLMIGDAIARKREIEKKRAAAKPGTFGNPIMARDVNHAIELINEGHFVELKKPEDIVTLTDRMVELNEEAIKKGGDMPSYGLCYASVEGTNLFCAEQFQNSKLGFIRAEMPQVGGKPRPGSKAHTKALEIEKATGKLPEEVTAGDEWLEALARNFITHEKTDWVASHMHASQNELVAKKVRNFTRAGLLRNEAIRKAEAGTPMLDPREEDFVDGVKVPNPGFNKPITLEMAKDMWHPGKDPIFVSRDGYVIDGHHRWAAVVAVDAADGTLGQDTMPVIVIDLSISEALADARAFTTDFGILAKSAKANDLAPDDAPDTPDTPDVPDVNPLQGTIAGDIVHHRGTQRDKREVIDPVTALIDSVLIAPPKRRANDQVHIITDTHSSKNLHGRFSPYGSPRAPSYPKMNGRRFNENLRKDTREDGYGGLPPSMEWDYRKLDMSTLNLSRNRTRDATAQEIEADAFAEREGRARPHLVFHREGLPLQTHETWDGTLEDIVDPTQLNQLQHDWGSWEEKGYGSQREYIDAVFEFVEATEEFLAAEREGFPELVTRKEIRVSKTVSGVEMTPQQRQLTLVHEFMHHFDYGYDPNSRSHMVSEVGAAVSHPLESTPKTVPQWAASGATPEDVTKGGIFYHASGEEVLGDLRSDGWGGNLHVGTLGAAGERAGMRRVDTEGTAVDNHVHEFSVTPKNPYLPNGVILRERDGARDSGLTNADIKRIIDDPERQAELLAEGYDVIPYINAIEQEGSVSYIILDPAAVTQTGGVGKATQTDVRGRGGAKIVEVDESNFVSAVPTSGSDAAEISAVGRAEADSLIQAAVNTPSMQKILSEEAGVNTKTKNYVFDPLEIFARIATQWLMAEHGNEGQRTAALEMAEKSLGMEDRDWTGTVSFTVAEMKILGPLVEEVLQSWNALK